MLILNAWAFRAGHIRPLQLVLMFSLRAFFCAGRSSQGPHCFAL